MRVAAKELAIRTYNRGDAPEVLALHRLGLESVGIRMRPGEWDADMNRIGEVYAPEKGGIFLVGEVDGRIVAIGGLRRSSEGVGELMRMRVSPEFQGRGYGRDILLELEAAAGEFGYHTLIAETSVIQPVAQAFYKAHGYVETERIPFRNEDLEITLVHFEKGLANGTGSEKTDLKTGRRDDTLAVARRAEGVTT